MACVTAVYLGEKGKGMLLAIKLHQHLDGRQSFDALETRGRVCLGVFDSSEKWLLSLLQG